MQLLSVYQPISYQRHVTVVFSGTLFVTQHNRRERKKAVTLEHLFMALLQLCESRNRLTKISDVSNIHPTMQWQLGANNWPLLHPVLCTDNSAQQNGEKKARL